MDKLRKLRKGKGLSLNDLGKVLGQSGQFVNRLEKGDTSLSLSHALTLMEYFKCDLADFWEEETHAEQLKFLSSYRKLNFAPLIDESEIDSYAGKDLSGHKSIESIRLLSQEAYAIKVEFDRRPKRFLDGDIIIIDPSPISPLKPGDYCFLRDNRGLKVWMLFKGAKSSEFISHEGVQIHACDETLKLGKVVDIIFKL